MKIIFLIVLSIASVFAQNEKPITLAGRITNTLNKEPVQGCIIIAKPSYKTVYSNINGFYQIQLPKKDYEITFKHISYEKILKNISLSGDSTSITLDVELKPATLESAGITVTSIREYPSVVMQKLTSDDVAKMPNVYSDVIRSIQLLPGTATNNELSSNYNVRGGSTDENLFYLNGYEIYRPLLLKIGVEENQPIVNPDLVKTLRFSNGAYSALYGDKMSSVLDIEYNNSRNSDWGGNIRADIMNAGLSVRKGFENGSVLLGVRKSYPALFLGTLHMKGDYNPDFIDAQLFATYDITENHHLEITAIINKNEYNVIPDNWRGEFGYNVRGNFGTLKINYDGKNNYSSNTNLIGAKYKFTVVKGIDAFVSGAQFKTTEKENGSWNAKYYVYPNAYNDKDPDTIKTRHFYNNNRVDLTSQSVKAGFVLALSDNTIELGGEVKHIELKNDIDENYYEDGKYALENASSLKIKTDSYKLNSFVLYGNDFIKISPMFTAEVGIRFLSNKYTSENLFSPRVGVIYYPNTNNIFSFNYGIYFQAPFYNELTGEGIDLSGIKSQRSDHYVFGWEWIGKKNISFQSQVYYKNLSNIIPFYYDGAKLFYTKGNINEGYAFGFDVMVKGNFVKGIDSRIGYSYINTKERKSGSGDSFIRRLYDQTHTLQVFIQDRIPDHPNWQAHFRLLAGSGFLVYDRKITTDPVTGKNNLEVVYSNPDELPYYMRADIGMTYEHQFENNLNLLIAFEILNVFDVLNFYGYEFTQVFPTSKNVAYIPKTLSSRMFNLKVNLSI